MENDLQELFDELSERQKPLWAELAERSRLLIEELSQRQERYSLCKYGADSVSEFDANQME